jgi:hypothetical protein
MSGKRPSSLGSLLSFMPCDSKEFASLSHTFDPNHRVSFDSLNMKMGSKTQSTLYENGWWVQCTQRSVLALLHQPK